MYKLKLNFKPYTSVAQALALGTAKGTSQRHRMQDVLTETACTLLLLNHNIHTTQASSDTIVFESDRDRCVAVLKLADHAMYTPSIID
jgi:hypothetical protein